MADIVDAFALFCGAWDGNAIGSGRTVAAADFAAYERLKGAYERVYAPLCEQSLDAKAKYLYVPTLDLSDKSLDALIEYTLDGDARLAVNCCSDLAEAGRIDARFDRSPVMLLHQFGLLERSIVLGGVYLDKDDLSLMAQEKIPLVVFPSSDAGHGHGVAPVCAALGRGVSVRIGSGDGAFNPRRDILREAWTLRMLVCSQMNDPDAVDCLTLARMCLPADAGHEAVSKTADIIMGI